MFCESADSITVGKRSFSLSYKTNQGIIALLEGAEGPMSPGDKKKAYDFMDQRRQELLTRLDDLFSEEAFMKLQTEAMRLLLTNPSYKEEKAVICQILGNELWTIYGSFVNGRYPTQILQGHDDSIGKLAKETEHHKLEMVYNLLELCYVVVLHIAGMHLKTEGVMSECHCWPTLPLNTWVAGEVKSRCNGVKSLLAKRRYDPKGFQSEHIPKSSSNGTRGHKRAALPPAELPYEDGDDDSDVVGSQEETLDGLELETDFEGHDDADDVSPAEPETVHEPAVVANVEKPYQLGFETVPQEFRDHFLEVLKCTDGVDGEHPLSIHRKQLSEAARSHLPEMGVAGLVVPNRTAAPEPFRLWFTLAPEYEDLITEAQSGSLDPSIEAKEAPTMGKRQRPVLEVLALIPDDLKTSVEDCLRCIKRHEAPYNIVKGDLAEKTFGDIPKLLELGILRGAGQHSLSSPFTALVKPYQGGHLKGMVYTGPAQESSPAPEPPSVPSATSGPDAKFRPGGRRPPQLGIDSVPETARELFVRIIKVAESPDAIVTGQRRTGLFHKTDLRNADAARLVELLDLGLLRYTQSSYQWHVKSEYFDLIREAQQGKLDYILEGSPAEPTGAPSPPNQGSEPTPPVPTPPAGAGIGGNLVPCTSLPEFGGLQFGLTPELVLVLIGLSDVQFNEEGQLVVISNNVTDEVGWNDELVSELLATGALRCTDAALCFGLVIDAKLTL